MISLATLKNGLAVVVEEMPSIESAAYDLLIPGGIITDAPALQGCSLILAELTARGAGKLASRQLSEAFDNLGIRHGESGGHDRYVYRGALVAENISKALEYVSLMVREPMLPEGEIDSIRSLFLQDIAALADNPARRAMVELSSRYYPEPFGRPSHGTEAGLKASSFKELRAEWERCFHPEGAILSVAGRVRTDEVLKEAERWFGGWQGKALGLPKLGALPGHRQHHIDFESAQLQIVLAYPSAKFGDPDYYAAKVLTGVLSGGMFGRLFIEVREKRGLCYSVYARHSATKEYGTMTAYAGTTPERAQETLDVMVGELRKVAGTVTDEELRRAKANIKSSLVIGEESAGSRAGSNAADWWLDRRIRTLDEIAERIDAVRARDIDRLIERYPATSFMLLTLGGKELVLPA